MSGLQRKTVLVGLIAVFLCANVVGPTLFWEPYESDVWQNCAFVAIGGLIAEVFLLATWAALGTMAVKYRLPLTAALLLAAACTYVIGLQLPEGDMPLDVAIIMIIGGAVMYFCVQVPMWIVRAVTKQRIDLPEIANADIKREANQFGLRYLLAYTAVVAVLVALVQHSLPKGGAVGYVPWYTILAGGTAFMVFSALVCLPSVWLALSTKFQAVCLVWLVGALWVGPLIVMAVLAGAIAPVRFDGDAVVGIFSFGLGVAGTTLLVLLIARALGYRLIGPNSERAARQHDEATTQE